MDEPIIDIFALALSKANASVNIGNKVTNVQFALNSQNLPTIRVTVDDGSYFNIVFWTNNRLILQKVEDGNTTNLSTWTGE